MKPIIRKTLETSTSSFIVRELKDAYFDPNWHFHPQYQLFLVVEGTGTRFIGDHIQTFGPGDLVFMGPNLPHLWRSDHQYFEGNHLLKVHGIVIYFREDFLGNEFFKKTEMRLIQQLLERAQRGVEFFGSTHTSIALQIKKLIGQSGFDSILSLLGILNELSFSSEFKTIASLGYMNNFKVSETDRMRKVHEYVMSNFKTNIHLAEVSALANMSSPAFCRYFKARANKTFSDFISEIRIGYACKLLIEEKLNVTQICYESGFKTLSNFNRQFKNITGKSPLKYQKEYMRGKS